MFPIIAIAALAPAYACTGAEVAQTVRQIEQHHAERIVAITVWRQTNPDTGDSIGSGLSQFWAVRRRARHDVQLNAQSLCNTARYRIKDQDLVGLPKIAAALTERYPAADTQQLALCLAVEHFTMAGPQSGNLVQRCSKAEHRWPSFYRR